MKLGFVGMVSILDTNKICVITIRYPYFALFSDISIGHKQSLHGRICDLLQNKVRGNVWLR